ncbi:MAG TPA: tetratricopeptide repeat protein, partial [Polyangiaceae bacterium]|nr:tetratricopeptide repeat protein [Polyangiaceae bacterium]
MFKVECPGCRAPYQVDERRVPSTGLKMRCPKCGTSFQVDQPNDPRRTGPSPVLGAGVARPPPPPPRGPGKGTMIGVAPAAVRIEAKAEPADSKPDDYGEADLPTIGGPAAKAPIPRAPVPRPGAIPRPQAAPPAAGPASPGPSSDVLDLDLTNDLPVPVAAKPKPSPAKPSGSFDLDDIDLPAARASAPAPGAAPPAMLDLDFGADPTPSMDLDLPEVGGARPAKPSGGEFDLPSPRLPAAGAALDLPAVPGAGKGRGKGAGSLDIDGPDSFGDLELPSPVAANRPASGLGDLPSPAAMNLPAAGRGAELPSPARGRDLPSPSYGRDLPSPSSGVGLPSRSQSGLPVTSAAGLPTHVSAGLPTRRDEGSPHSSGRSVFDLEPQPEDEFALEPPTQERPQVRGSGPPQAAANVGDHFGEIALPGSDPFGPAELPAQGSSAADRQLAATMANPESAQVTRAGGGGTNYGEVNLDGGEAGAEMPIEAPAPPVSQRPPEEEMEFGAIPQEAAPQPGRVVSPAAAAIPRARRRLGVRVFAALFIVAVGGAALALAPDIGPFGAYWIIDQLKADEYARLLSDTVNASRRALGRDTALDAQTASTTAEAAQHRGKRIPGLKAYAAFVGYARELRFGVDSPVRARANVLLDELSEVDSAPYLALARAARAAAEGEVARARSMVQALEQRSPRDPDVLVLKGELLLREADAKAVLAWEAAGKVEASARTAYGLARAKYAATDFGAAERLAQQALEKNPDHVGARILIARLMSRSREKETAAAELLDAIIKSPAKASEQELVNAQTLLGDIHLSRSRISLAEAAYGAALKVDPKSARALGGLGEAIFRAGRFSEALARFEAASQADPKDLDAAVGVAKSKLMLERADDSLQILKKLAAQNPKASLVAYWYGKALESLGSREQAQAVYSAALKQAPRDPALVDLYVALALLQNQLGQTELAKRTLSDASSAMPGSPAIHRALGELALGEGRYDEALSQFQHALEIDREDLAARFKLGVTLRRQGKFEQATKALDAVSAADKEYPGLALERGLLFEATGRSDEALKAYEAALSRAPNDPDLMLRVGCGNVAAGRGSEAEPILRKVMALRSSSAETNHCLGRALLLQGRLADAQRLLDRAVELDPNRAEYHLYVGWAASDAGDLIKAERELDQALKLDQGLADAYWQRGVLRSRQGAVRDAISDLRKA